MTYDSTFAVVIATFNEERNIGRLLESIRRQVGVRYSIAVVDQGSSDRTADIARSFGCTVLEVPTARLYTGLARSRNAGAAAIQGDILLHLDADMELSTADSLQRMS